MTRHVLLIVSYFSVALSFLSVPPANVHNQLKNFQTFYTECIDSFDSKDVLKALASAAMGATLVVGASHPVQAIDIPSSLLTAYVDEADTRKFTADATAAKTAIQPSDTDNQLVQMAFRDFDQRRFDDSDKEFSMSIEKWRSLSRYPL